MPDARDVPSPEEVLLGCAFARGLPNSVVHALVARSRVEFAPEGSALWTAQTPARFLAVLHSGLVKMTRATPQGEEVVVEILGSGELTGLLAALCDTDYPLSAWAVTDSWFLRIPHREWANAFEGHPALRQAILDHMGPRLLEAFDFLATMLCGSVEQRVATALLKVSQVLPSEEPDTVAISHSALAGLAHTTVESCIRTTSRWQEQGWLEKSHRSLRVVRPDRLRRVLHSFQSSKA